MIVPLEGPSQRTLADGAITAEVDLDSVERHLFLKLGLEEECPIKYITGCCIVCTLAGVLPMLSMNDRYMVSRAHEDSNGVRSMGTKAKQEVSLCFSDQRTLPKQLAL